MCVGGLNGGASILLDDANTMTLLNSTSFGEISATAKASGRCVNYHIMVTEWLHF
jgi:hypothetical protein